MQPLPLPSTITVTGTGTPHEALVTIGPLFPGYGMTIGNTLRRVLLNSLVGGAITSVRIQGVEHEFSTIEGVKEDVVDILLNIKKLRFYSHQETPITLTLKAHGKKTVTAGDFDKNADVTVVMKDLPIATMTSSSSKLEMECVVEQGRGYVTTESRDTRGKLPLGTIVVDSIFTPVEHVGLKVENVRVGQMTNYDKLLMTMRTDGTKTPEEALRQALEIVLSQFNHIASALAVPSDEPVQDLAVEEVAGEHAVVESEEEAAPSQEDAPKKRRSKKS